MKSIFSVLKRTKNTFDIQEDDEKVILTLRRHPLVIIIPGLVAALLALLPLFVLPIFSLWFGYYDLVQVLFFLSSIWYLVLWSGFFYSLTMYLLDVWIVTDKRIIDSNQHAFFNRTVSEMRLEKIQDISVNIEGALPTLFNFGELEIQSAGAVEKFKFFQIPEPGKVKDTIMKAVAKKGHHKV